MSRSIIASFSCLVMLAASPLPAADSDSRSVVTTRDMPAAPDRVLQAFVSDTDLKAWWKVTRSLVESRSGGVWSISWDDWGEERTHHSWTGVIEEISAEKLVIGRMVMIEPDMPLLGPMRLEIAIAPAENGSSVTVTHSGYGYGDHWDTMYELVVTGWDHVLGDLQEWFREDY